MKLLLLTDIPPCDNYTGGSVIAEYLRLPQLRNSVAAFIVLNPALRPNLCPDLSDIAIEIVDKPNEHGQWQHGPYEAFASEHHKATVLRDELVERAVAFGRSQGATAVWAVLEGQTIIRMALPLARALGVPLYTQVWDPPSWWLRDHHVDPRNATAVLEQFEATLRASRACATASWNMAAHYGEAYGTRCVPIIAGYDRDAARTPPLELRHRHEIVIGMAGQFYADDAWATLLAGLEAEDWRIAGRTVSIFYVGGRPAGSPELPDDRCAHGGYLPPEAAIDALALHADILYCPYPFRAEMVEVGKLSFPSKIVMYAAAGRPILCHAPHDSSPAQYLARTGAGAVCGTLDARAIYDMVRWVASDPSVYARLASAAQDAFREDFTRTSMERSVAAFFT